MKWIAGIGIAMVIILLLFRYPDIMISPGPLLEGHQDLNHSCMACHVPFGGIVNDRCITCHKVEDIGKDSLQPTENLLFHHMLANQSCNSCHTDHAGIHPPSAISGFDHHLLSDSLINNCIRCHQQPADELHQQVSPTCISCHNTDAWTLTSPFNHDYLLTETKNNCASCHEAPVDDMHRYARDNCATCHSTTQWVPSTFAHGDYFVLDEDHNVKCTVCHTTTKYTAYTCYGCHEHTEPGMRAEHSEEGIYNINDCASCHKSANEDDIKHNMERQGGDRRNENEGDDD
jgi:hypothetical protein